MSALAREPTKNEAVSSPLSTNYQPSNNPNPMSAPPDQIYTQPMPPSYAPATAPPFYSAPLHPMMSGYPNPMISTTVMSMGMAMPQFDPYIFQMKTRATIMAIVSFFLGGFWCCCLSIPALVFARYDPMAPGAREKYKTSMILSGIAIGCGALAIVGAIAYAIVRSTAMAASAGYYYNSYGYGSGSSCRYNTYYYSSSYSYCNSYRSSSYGYSSTYYACCG